MWILLAFQLAHTYVQRYGRIRAYDMAIPPLICIALSLALVWRRRYWMALIPMLFLQHVYYGGIHLFPQMFIHGRLSIAHCIPILHTNVHIIVMSSGVPKRLNHMQNELAQVKLGYDLRVFNDSSLDIGMRHCSAMRSVLTGVYKTEWLLIFEDDAVLHWKFLWQLACAMGADKDVTFLDARSAIIYNLLRVYEGSTAGTLIRTRSLPLITAHMCAGKPLYDQAVREIGRGKNVTADIIFATLCNQRNITCQVWPLVSEAGFVSTN